MNIYNPSVKIPNSFFKFPCSFAISPLLNSETQKCIMKANNHQFSTVQALKNNILKSNSIDYQIRKHIDIKNNSSQKLLSNSSLNQHLNNSNTSKTYCFKNQINIASIQNAENKSMISPEIKLLVIITKPSKKIQIQIDSSKCSSKGFGVVMAYAANTNSGLIRFYDKEEI